MKNKAIKITLILLSIMLILSLTKTLVIAGIILLLIASKIKQKDKIKKNDEEIELEVINTQEHDAIRMTAKLLEEQKNIKLEVMRNTDVRQFQGRNDVTIQEVADYMIQFSQYIGLEKRNYQMERITQVCNLTNDDMKEVAHLIWGKCKIQEDPEGQKEADYMLEQMKKSRNDFQKLVGNKSTWRKLKDDYLRMDKTDEQRRKTEELLPEEWIRQKEDEEYEKNEKTNRYIDYDGWLRWKGYIK